MYRESDLVELKQQLTDEVKCEIDAFLNTKGGTIYIALQMTAPLCRLQMKNQKTKQT